LTKSFDFKVWGLKKIYQTNCVYKIKISV
jgi:hypothetical protein